MIYSLISKLSSAGSSYSPTLEFKSLPNGIKMPFHKIYILFYDIVPTWDYDQVMSLSRKLQILIELWMGSL